MAQYNLLPTKDVHLFVLLHDLILIPVPSANQYYSISASFTRTQANFRVRLSRISVDELIKLIHVAVGGILASSLTLKVEGLPSLNGRLKESYAYGNLPLQSRPHHLSTTRQTSQRMSVLDLSPLRSALGVLQTR